MSLNIHLTRIQETEVYERNITHNLGAMAEAAGIYKHLWCPEELEIKAARDLIKPLEKGLQWLADNPEEAKKHNPKNGWGDYNGLVNFVSDYLGACKQYPDANIWIHR